MDIKSLLKKQSTIMVLTVIAVVIGVLGTSYAAFFKVATIDQLQTVAAGDLKITYSSGNEIVEANAVPTDDSFMNLSNNNGFIFEISSVAKSASGSTFPSEYEIYVNESKYYKKESFYGSGCEENFDEENVAPSCMQHLIELNDNNRVDPKYIRFSLESLNKISDDYDNDVYDETTATTIASGTLECLTAEDYPDDLTRPTCLNSTLLTSGTINDGTSVLYRLKLWLIKKVDDNSGVNLPPNDVIGKVIAYNVMVKNKIKTPVVSLKVTNGNIVDLADDGSLTAGSGKRTLLNGSNTTFYVRRTSTEFMNVSGGSCPAGTTVGEGFGCKQISCTNGVNGIIKYLTNEGQFNENSYDSFVINNITQDAVCELKYTSGTSITMSIEPQSAASMLNSSGESVKSMEVAVPTSGSDVIHFEPVDGYAFDELECYGDNSELDAATMNTLLYSKQYNTLTVSPGGRAPRCTIKFKETLVKHLIDNAVSLAPTDESKKGLKTITTTYDPVPSVVGYNVTDYRYQGANPDNYLLFNNKVWRIIGVIQVADSNPGSDEVIYGDYRVYLRATGDNYLAAQIWHKSSSNDWRNSSIKTALTTMYNAYSTDAKSQISNIPKYLGGFTTGDSETITPIQSFKAERDASGASRMSGRTDVYTDTDSPLSIMTVSDYGFAAYNCENKAIANFNIVKSVGTGQEDPTCADVDWMFTDLSPTITSSYTQWTMTQQILTTTSSAIYVHNISSAGALTASRPNRAVSSGKHYSYPTVYLNSDVVYQSGVGTNDSGLFQIS